MFQLTGIFLLDISELPGGTAENYHDHIITALRNASTDYAKSRKLDSQVIIQNVKSRISSTMSDRAIVNTKTVRLLENTLGRDLLMLNCNVHPLDGISLAFRKGLRDYGIMFLGVYYIWDVSTGICGNAVLASTLLEFS